jgi:hypothetical protein
MKDVLVWKEDDADLKCAKCGDKNLQRRMSIPSDYYAIKGDNSASTRPKKSKSNL